MRLEANIARMVRPEFGPLPVARAQVNQICETTPTLHSLTHLWQGKDTAACGAVSAFMLLESLGVTDQKLANIYDRTHAFDPDWNVLNPDGETWHDGSSPLGLVQTMQGLTDQGTWDRYGVLLEVDRERFNRWLLWSVTGGEASPIVLVHRRDHWLVVNGCKVSQSPQSVVDTNYEVCYLYLDDPAFGCDPDPLYAQLPFFEALTYEEWNRTYLDEPAPDIRYMPTELYASKFVAITYPDNDERDLTPAGSTGMPGEDLEFQCDVDQVKSVVDGEPLFSDSPWFNYPGAVRPLEALPVLDHTNPDDHSCETAFVVDDPDGTTRIVLIVRTNSDSGAFRSAVATTLDGRLAVGDGKFFELTAEEFLSYLDQFGVTWTIDGVTYAPVPQDVPQLFWRPCRESMSPYLPFYPVLAQPVNAQGQPIGPVETINVRLDGQAFRTITDVWPGETQGNR